MAEPGQLALGVVAGGLLELFGAGIQRGRPLKIREEFLIADGLRCRAVDLAVVIDQLCLIEEAGVQHLVHPQVDAAVELGAIGKVQTQHQRTIGPLRREGLGFLLAQTLAGGPEMFQRPQDPHLIVRMDGGGGFRVGGLQLFVHSLRAFFRHLCGQLFPQAVRRLLGGEADTVQKALDIEARAAHEDRQTAPGGNVRLERSGQRHEIRHAEGLVRLQNIHRMVRDAVGLFGRDLRRTDV